MSSNHSCTRISGRKNILHTHVPWKKIHVHLKKPTKSITFPLWKVNWTVNAPSNGQSRTHNPVKRLYLDRHGTLGTGQKGRMLNFFCSDRSNHMEWTREKSATLSLKVAQKMFISTKLIRHLQVTWIISTLGFCTISKDYTQLWKLQIKQFVVTYCYGSRFTKTAKITKQYLPTGKGIKEVNKRISQQDL